MVLNRERHAAAWEVGRDAFDPQAVPPPLRGSPRRRRPAIEAGGVARVRLDDVLLRRGEPERREPARGLAPAAARVHDEIGRDLFGHLALRRRTHSGDVQPITSLRAQGVDRGPLTQRDIAVSPEALADDALDEGPARPEHL